MLCSIKSQFVLRNSESNQFHFCQLFYLTLKNLHPTKNVDVNSNTSEKNNSMARIAKLDAKLDASSSVSFMAFFRGYEGYSLTQRRLGWRIALHNQNISLV